MILILGSLLLAIVLSAMSVTGDYFIKRGSMQAGLGWGAWKFVIIGSLFYFCTAFGWFFVMRTFKLSVVGTFFSLSYLIILIGISVFVFKEKIRIAEMVAMVMALGAIVLLAGVETAA